MQRGGNRFRLNAQLTDTETGSHVWAERFDKPAAELFDMQDEIVSRLANTLNAELIAAEARRAERSPRPDAMDLVFPGQSSAEQGRDSCASGASKGFLHAIPGARSRQHRSGSRRGSGRCVRGIGVHGR